MKKQVIAILLVILVMNGCFQPPESKEQEAKSMLQGAWSYVLNDSIYGEVIFLDDRLWEHHGVIGEFDRKYKISNDSLIIMAPEDYPELKVRLRIISPDAFTANSEGMATSYFRIEESKDWEKVVNRLNPDYSDYLDGFEKRYIEYNR